MEPYLTFDVISVRYKDKGTSLMTSQWRFRPPSAFLTATVRPSNTVFIRWFRPDLCGINSRIHVSKQGVTNNTQGWIYALIAIWQTCTCITFPSALCLLMVIDFGRIFRFKQNTHYDNELYQCNSSILSLNLTECVTWFSPTLGLKMHEWYAMAWYMLPTSAQAFRLRSIWTTSNINNPGGTKQKRIFDHWPLVHNLPISRK